MSYETAPSTRLVATHCACCNRPLVDAKSVEIGMGPVCRDKHGFNHADEEPNWGLVMTELDGFVPVASVNPTMDPRVAANKLVYELAAMMHEYDSVPGGQDAHREGVAARINAVCALGYVKLSSILAKRCTALRVVTAGEDIEVETAYNSDFVYHGRSVPGRRWDSKRKVTIFPAEQRDAVWALFVKVFPGQFGFGAAGVFEIPSTIAE